MDYSKIYFEKLTPDVNSLNLPHIIWGHGWGNSHLSLLPIANSLKNLGTHWLLDFPGFGLTPEPDLVWGIKEYTDIIYNWIKSFIPANIPKIWIGHSFGCRVGINLAAKHPELIKGLLLIASAGVPRPLHFLQRIRLKSKIYIFKILKHIVLLFKKQQYVDSLRASFGSIDYKNASPIMQKILVKIIHEDLTLQAKEINCPAELIYGMQDTETPIIVGKILHKLIKNSKLHIIPHKDHWSILEHDLYQVTFLLKNFIKTYGN